ncbi:hypothetical protein L6164_020340 [Bauhinia variegata]|uniref:Uncharacterized protein n=2 Tax=Bauhinia variegata TaxID=167791 RepID=A0ACB9MWT4_BAUVA|nr:hypothetical protein L6164_020340 [Bauhinia variegata]
MVGFSELSDTDESVIDEIISQAQDACVLEQISAINCSGFTDSVLPTELESRFRKLKTFPSTKAKGGVAPPRPVNGKSGNVKPFNSKTMDSSPKGKAEFDSPSDEGSPKFSPSKENPDKEVSLDRELQSGIVSPPSDSLDISKKNVNFSPVRENSKGNKDVKLKSTYGPVSSPSGTSDLSEESSVFSQFKPKPDARKGLKLQSKSRSLSSPLSSSNSFRSSPSPPRKASCFWCSPKKQASKKKSKENWAMNDVLGWDIDDEFLSDMGSFSAKKQQKMLKKAMKEEEKISQEAEKIVKWAKQASARMSVEDDLSDD